MKNILFSLFDSLATFSEYVQGVETSNTLDDMQSSGRTAKKRVESVISPSVFSAIVDSEDEALLDALRSAVANMTLSVQLVFDTINRRKAGTDVYKYELEQMRRAYTENYFNAMDTLISTLTSTVPKESDTTSPAAKWREARYFKLIDNCQIKSADDFDTIYPIDLSYLFFFRTVPLQKETLDERLSAYYDKTDDDRIIAMLNLALAKKTIAKALRRFDILEFPPTIRNLFDDNTASRNGKDEHGNALALADRLDAEADQLLENVDMLLDGDTTDFASFAAYNTNDDIIVMAP